MKPVFLLLLTFSLLGFLKQGLGFHHRSGVTMECDTYDPGDPNSFE